MKQHNLLLKEVDKIARKMGTTRQMIITDALINYLESLRKVKKWGEGWK